MTSVTQFSASLRERAKIAWEEEKRRRQEELEERQRDLLREIMDFMPAKIGCVPDPSDIEYGSMKINGEDTPRLRFRIDGVNFQAQYSTKYHTYTSGGDTIKIPEEEFELRVQKGSSYYPVDSLEKLGEVLG